MLQLFDILKGSSSNTSSKPKEGYVLPIIGIVMSLLLLTFAWWVAKRPTPTKWPKVFESKLTQVQIDAFFDIEVLPALDTFEYRNKTAVERALDQISNGVEEYRIGIKPFIEDITSWGTRFGVIHRLASDQGEKWWGDSTKVVAVDQYISEKFERHLFSDAKLKALVTASLNQFRDDITANQNRLHSDIKAAWDKYDYSQYDLNLEKIIQQVNETVQVKSADMATDALTVGVVSFIAGYALEESTTMLVKPIITRIATLIAATTAVKTTTTTAGAGGTVIGGPVGTVIGVSAGLVVGIIMDLWMTNKLEKKLTAECDKMITDVKNQILFGTEEEPGLKQAFIETIKLLRSGEITAIKSSIKEAS